MLLMGMPFECSLELSVKTFHQAISAGVIRCCSYVFGSQESCECLPQVRLKLPTSVRCDSGGCTKTSDPGADERLSHSLSSAVLDGYCFWPACKAVYTCQQVCKTTRGRQGPNKVNVQVELINIRKTRVSVDCRVEAVPKGNPLRQVSAKLPNGEFREFHMRCGW